VELQESQLIISTVREVSTTSSLKPGMVASLGVGVATGGIGMAAAIGGGMAVGSEALLVSVEQDAKRAATAVSERIIQGYKDRGWLTQ
jgi:anti-sigma factor RsiW